MQLAAQTIIVDGAEHLGETFDTAYKDKSFVDKVVKRTRMKSENMKSLTAYFKARVAKKAVSSAVGSAAAPVADVPPAQAAAGADGYAEWAIVPYRPKGRKKADDSTCTERATSWLPKLPKWAGSMGARWAQLFWRWRFRTTALVLILFFPHVTGVVLGALAERLIRHTMLISGTAFEVVMDAGSQAVGQAFNAWVYYEKKLASDLWSYLLGSTPDAAPTMYHHYSADVTPTPAPREVPDSPTQPHPGTYLLNYFAFAAISFVMRTCW